MSMHDSTADTRFMRQALGLAIQGRGAVEPNPMVGCLLVKDGRVLAEGYHRRFGLPHAEPDALARCPEPPIGATAYVTLEPCCHTNKKTPPCVPQLIAASLSRVVIGCVDPNPAVAGQGIEQLRQAGIRVDVGILNAECRQANAAFFAQIVRRRPYVTLKWAQSADGKVAGPQGRRAWISNETSRQAVHELRARCDAILVGINTAVADDPLLTARHTQTPRPLTRLVLDRDLRLPAGSQLVRSLDQGPLILFCGEQTIREQPERVACLRSHQVQVVGLPTDASGNLSLPDLLADLGRRPITHLIVEPGPTLAQSFLSQGLADRVWVFHSPTLIGDDSGPPPGRSPTRRLRKSIWAAINSSNT